MNTTKTKVTKKNIEKNAQHILDVALSVAAPVSTINDVTAQYVALKETEKQVKAQIEALREQIMSTMDKQKNETLTTPAGTFVIQTKHTLTWSLDTVKSVFGREWTAFVEPSTKLIKARMATEDAVSEELAAAASSTETRALTVK